MAERKMTHSLTRDGDVNDKPEALADLKRASGKYEEALALYREQLDTDQKESAVRAESLAELKRAGNKSYRSVLRQIRSQSFSIALNLELTDREKTYGRTLI